MSAPGGCAHFSQSRLERHPLTPRCSLLAKNTGLPTGKPCFFVCAGRYAAADGLSALFQSRLAPDDGRRAATRQVPPCGGCSLARACGRSAPPSQNRADRLLRSPRFCAGVTTRLSSGSGALSLSHALHASAGAKIGPCALDRVRKTALRAALHPRPSAPGRKFYPFERRFFRLCRKND